MSIELLLDKPYQKEAKITTRKGSVFNLTLAKMRLYRHPKDNANDPLVPFTFHLSTKDDVCPVVTQDIRGHITYAAENLTKHYPCYSFFFAFDNTEKYETVLELLRIFGPAHDFHILDTVAAQHMIGKWSHFTEKYRGQKIIFAVKTPFIDKYSRDWVNVTKL